MATPATTAPKKAKKKDIKITTWVLHVRATSNNTLITLTDEQWNKVAGGGTGLIGYKGSKKSTPYAAEVLTKKIVKEGQDCGLKEMWIIFAWPGMSRDGIFKAINEIGVVDITYIKESTGIQFGWCKWKRPKRN